MKNEAIAKETSKVNLVVLLFYRSDIVVNFEKIKYNPVYIIVELDQSTFINLLLAVK